MFVDTILARMSDPGHIHLAACIVSRASPLSISRAGEARLLVAQLIRNCMRAEVKGAVLLDSFGAQVARERYARERYAAGWLDRPIRVCRRPPAAQTSILPTACCDGGAHNYRAGGSATARERHA